MFTGSLKGGHLRLPTPTRAKKTGVGDVYTPTSALGTLIFYDCGGYSYTVGENFNAVCGAKQRLSGNNANTAFATDTAENLSISDRCL